MAKDFPMRNRVQLDADEALDCNARLVAFAITTQRSTAS